MKNTLGILAVIIGFIGYIPYFRTMFSGKTKPHALPGCEMLDPIDG